MALKESQRLERELTGYVDWICRAEDLVLAEDRTTEADREMILEGQLHLVIFLPGTLSPLIDLLSLKSLLSFSYDWLAKGRHDVM